MIPTFRAWDKLNNKMVRNFYRSRMAIEGGGVLYQLVTTKCNCIAGTASYNTYEDKTYRYRHDLQLMQSTGLKDNNGVEIFEGDIVEIEVNDGFDYGSFIGVVTYLEGAWMIDNRINFSRLLWSETEEVEILGNIHETPELLEGESE